jgi:murein DD-endopeptidase MepM/ murein hydrolase activator NlpD
MSWRFVFVKRLAIVTLLFAFLFTSITPALAIDLKTAKNEKSNVDSRISKLNASKKEILEKKAALERQKKKVANAQAAENNAYKELVGQITEAQKNLEVTKAALADAVAKYNSQLELVKTRLNVMYQNSSATMLDTLLESKNVIEFYERLQYMSIIAQSDSELISDLNADKLDVEYKKKMQLAAEALLEDKASEKRDKLATLKNSRAELEDQLSRSKAELAKLEKEEDALLAESKRLQSVIKNLSRSTGKYAGGTMKWPLPSSFSITSTFGMRKHPILRKYKMHTGIDIDGETGNSIIAANKGTVIMAQYDNSGGYGRMIVIDHGGGISTLYAHCSKLLVSVGDVVKSGEVIARVGSTGLSTGSHLHFEVRKNGDPVNPLKGYLKN